jgi:hypothetical protein
MKTFIWKGSRAQAQRGSNDDLVISLAIGVWLYDTSPNYNKQSVDVNKAMLTAFSVNRNRVDESVIKPWATGTPKNPYQPMILNSIPDPSGSMGGALGDLSWLTD